MTAATVRLSLARLTTRRLRDKLLRGGPAAWTTSLAVAALAFTAGAHTSSAPTNSAPTLLAVPRSDLEESTTISILDERLHHAWPNDAQGLAWFGSGGYQVFARQPGQFVAIRAPLASAVDDVVLSGVFRKTGGPPGGGYGLIVRDQRQTADDGVDQSGDFLVAAVGDRGDIGVWRREGQHWLDLVPWTAASSVRPGSAQNELRVRASGSRLYFDVNGIPVADLDVPLQSGRVGLFVGGDQNQVLVEKLVVQPLQRATRASLGTQPPPLAQAQIAAPSAREVQPPPVPDTQGSQLRDQAVQLLAVVQGLSHDLDSDQPTSGRDLARVQHARALMADIQQEVFAIFRAFENGIDSPTSPVNKPSTLAEAAAHLESATRKAGELRMELDAIRSGYARGGL
jgi:hypothetical protein